MLAQVVLTPTESKRLISKAIADMKLVRNAATDGMVVLQPSSSTYFIVEELTGIKPNTNYWVCGMVAPRGTCMEMGTLVGNYFPTHEEVTPGEFRNWWVIRHGNLIKGEKISKLLEQSKSTDVFIKGVNAIDSHGNLGILIGSPVEGGPLGYIFSGWRKKSFHWVFPVGLEKLIPGTIYEASQEAKQTKYDYAMGLPTGLFVCPQDETIVKITEIDAIKMLSGAIAIPISAGGLGGAEGAITMVIKGDKEQVKKAIDFIERSKGARLPQLRLLNCTDCPSKHCKFPVNSKHWVHS